MHWLWEAHHSSVDNLRNVRREKKKEYLRAKIDELETNSKIKNIRLV
jgi:hypothetical protein